MRLIDADALHDALKTKQMWVVRCGDKHNEGYTYDQVHFTIDNAPTIDAVSVVRCKECRLGEFYEVDTGEDYMTGLWCALNQKDCMIDDFCSYGEREGE